MSRHRVWSGALLFGLLVLCVLAGCVLWARMPRTASIIARSPRILPASPVEVRHPPSAAIRYVDMARSAGLNYTWKNPGKRPFNILQTIGHGCAFLDYDIDGNLDILLVGPHPALYKGDGHGHFVDTTQQLGLSRYSAHFLGCAVGDYDNDSYPDLYLSGYYTGLLLQNQAGRRFRDKTSAAGLVPQPWGTSCGFADMNEDGFLDLYIANYVDFSPQNKPQLCPEHGILIACGPRVYNPLKGRLYINKGHGHFRDETVSSGANAHNGRGLGVAFADYDDSGHVSLAVANDETTSDLLENLGQARFHNVGRASGMAVNDWGSIYAGMGIDWGDYDNDGRFDLFITTYHNEPKSLFQNQGDGLFKDRSQSNGITHATVTYLAFGTKFLDADNDGWLDLLIANGHVNDNIAVYDKEQAYRQPAQLLRNGGGAAPRFEDISTTATMDKLSSIVGRGLAIGDYDNDGRMDALIVDDEGAPLLLHNETRKAGHWVGFRLIGTGRSNGGAYGAKVTVKAGGRQYLRQCQPSGSYLSSSDPRVHCGIGEATVLDSVTVHWPDGKTQQWHGLKADRYITLREN